MSYMIRKSILDVPFGEKDQAKELGARWDPDLRKWFVPAGKDPSAFERWFPKPGDKDSKAEAT